MAQYSVWCSLVAKQFPGGREQGPLFPEKSGAGESHHIIPRRRLGRVFEHGKKGCFRRHWPRARRCQKRNPLPSESSHLLVVVNAFIQLRQERHEADYNTGKEWDRIDVMNSIYLTCEGRKLPRERAVRAGRSPPRRLPRVILYCNSPNSIRRSTISEKSLVRMLCACGMNSGRIGREIPPSFSTSSFRMKQAAGKDCWLPVDKFNPRSFSNWSRFSSGTFCLISVTAANLSLLCARKRLGYNV